MHRKASLLALLAVASPASVTAHACEAQVQAAEERVRDQESRDLKQGARDLDDLQRKTPSAR